jgi:peptidoglycan hydrolase-like protein with peptidoglycan-binding domain
MEPTMADEPDVLSDIENDPEWVRFLQQTLDYWGVWSGEQDGVFSPELEQCVKDFQSQQNLVVDGWVGPRTWCVLNREGAVIELDQFPKLKELGEIGSNESALEQQVATVLGVDDARTFSESEGQLA